MARSPPIAALRNVTLTLGAAPLFFGVDISLTRGQRIALVGRNGAGKSTLMRILAGQIDPDGGERFFQPGVASRYLRQEPDFGDAKTAIDYVGRGLGPDAIYRAHAELDAWGAALDLPLATASGGQARRVALAEIFAHEPDIVLLDEPTNHLDVPAIEQLERELLAFRGAALIVSHDRRFLETISTDVAWLRQGAVKFMNRSYSEFEQFAEELEEAEEKALDRLNTQLKAEERWMARGVTARRRRNMGRVRKLQDMRAEKRARKTALNEAGQAANLAIDAGGQSSRLVIEAKGLSKSFAGPEGPLPVVTDLNLRLMRGDRLGIVGPNGAGKTTLLRLLLGTLPPDGGTIRRAGNLDIAYLDQTRITLKPGDTLWDAMAPAGGDQIMVRGHPKHVAAYAKDFMFDARQLRQPVTALSGGERNRLTLALALAKPSNLLVLDEPTNDLDIETLDLLEEMLADYDGTLLLVSHDRAFIDGVVTSLLTPLEGGRWLETPGGWSDFLTQRPVREAAAQKSQTARQISPAAPPAPAAPKAKLSYKDARQLEELEKLTPKLTAEIAELEKALADPNLFARDPKVFASRTARHSAAVTELQAAELEWLTLEEKREALARG